MMLLALSMSALSLRGVRVMSDIEREEIAKMEYTRPTSCSEIPNSSGHASRQALDDDASQEFLQSDSGKWYTIEDGELKEVAE